MYYLGVDVEHHVARRPRAGDRRAGRCVDRDGRERVPPYQRAGRGPAGADPYEEQPREVIVGGAAGRPRRSSSRWRSSSCRSCRCSCSRRRKGGCSGRWRSPRRSRWRRPSLLSITLVPVLMTLFFRGRRLQARGGQPVLPAVDRHLRADPARRRCGGSGPTLAGRTSPWSRSTIPLIFLLGSEFMPPLYEGLAALHADGAAGHVDHRRHAAAAGAGPAARGLPRSGARVRHGRPRHDADRQLADGHGQHDHRAEAARANGGRA